MPSNGKKTAGRDPVTGRFTKGNDGGGRKEIPAELKEAFRKASWKAHDVLVEILQDETAKDSDRIRCAEIILERGYGKPEQAVSLETVSADVGVVLLPPVQDE